ncbi:uncharacterized protein METZ01_LOCUS150967 [marine metagenome]|uniref:Uncharacterized protein n=1 Tax=marine metagenome TaxID=408172 RepID=A0A382AAX5_9ZZZZ
MDEVENKKKSDIIFTVLLSINNRIRNLRKKFNKERLMQ